MTLLINYISWESKWQASMQQPDFGKRPHHQRVRADHNLHFIDKSLVADITILHSTIITYQNTGKGIPSLMPSNLRPFALADPKRFKTIQDLTQLRPDCGASIDDIFVVDHQLLMIVDLSRIGGIMNPYNSPSADYIRTHAVIVGSYNRDVTCPVFWNAPFLLLPMSYHLIENLMAYNDIGKIVGTVSCPSGALLLLPVRMDTPTPLADRLDEALAKEAGPRIKLPNGTYRVFYEQFDVPKGAKKELYQNIVVQKQ